MGVIDCSARSPISGCNAESGAIPPLIDIYYIIELRSMKLSIIKNNFA